MTREHKILEILRDKIERDGNHIIGLEDATRAILAEMAGEWNAGIESAAKAADAVSLHAQSRIVEDGSQLDYRQKIRRETARSIGDAIHALRRPDAAPARPATPSVEEVAHALFMADTGRANSLRLEADGYYRKLARAVIALRRPDAALERPTTDDERRINEIEARVRPTLTAEYKGTLGGPPGISGSVDVHYRISQADFETLMNSRIAWKFTAKCFAAEEATPSVEEVARAIDPIAMAAPSQDAPWVLRRGVARERAAAVITLFAKERL